MTEYFIQVIATFVRRRDGQPLAGAPYHACVYDKDLVSDDFLGQQTPDEHGRIAVLSNSQLFTSIDSWLETKPDLYVALFNGDREIFRSPVRPDVSVVKPHPVTGQMNSLTVDLGTFRVDAE